MTINPDGTVWIEEGEAAPCFCEKCDHIYQPIQGSMASECPMCNRVIIHAEQRWEALEMRRSVEVLTENKRYKVRRKQ